MMLYLLSTLAGLAFASHATTCSTWMDVGKAWTNACDEYCVCESRSGGSYGYSCFRQRKEISCLSTEERERFLDAYKAISTPGHPLYSQYQQLMNYHTSSTFGAIHDNFHFLPWHRWYILELENILRNIDCRITVPWYDWAKVSTSWQTSKPFLDAPTWFGEDGGSGFCVDTGAFAYPGWATLDGTCLQRSFSSSDMPTYTSIQNVISSHGSGDYYDFSNDLEGIHDTPHVRIGGDMVSPSASLEPVFFLHHAHIDRIWSQWQDQGSAFLNAFHTHDPHQAMNYAQGVTPAEVMDLSNQLGGVKVKYVRWSLADTNHFVLFACLRIRVSPLIELSMVDFDNMLSVLTPDDLTRIQQVKWAPLTDAEKQHRLNLIQESDPNNQEMLQEEEASMKASQDRQEAFFARAANNIVEECDLPPKNESDSRLFGFNLLQAYEVASSRMNAIQETSTNSIDGNGR